MPHIRSKHNSQTRDCRVPTRLPSFWFSVILLGVLSSGLGLVGCTTDDHKQNADEVREKTAETTAELKRNAKSVAEGVKEGWSRDKQRVDLNTASRDELVGTGLTRTQSDRVIEHRPYASPRELLTKHVLSEDEYKQIEPHVRAGDSSDN
jgi:Helix-hairpin-helix motif